MTNQESIINAIEPYVVVNASAAAGKTYCITERVKHLLETGVNPWELVVITFTNMAAEEMRERIGENEKGIYIGTIHAYINYLLLTGGVDTGKILEEEKFDELFELIKDNRDCVKPIQHLLLDEAQDTDTQQWNIIFEILHPKNWTVVGDTRQSIYSFRGAEPENFSKLLSSPEVQVYDLIQNYRNGSNILNFAKHIIDGSEEDLSDNSVAMSSNRGWVIETEFNMNYIIEQIKQHNEYDYKDWFILTRTNKELEQVFQGLEKAHIPCDTFKRSELTHSQLTDRMAQDTIKVLTIHAAKGLEAKAVVVIGAKFWNDEERRVNYVAATRAKELLIWTKTPKKQPKKKKQISNITNWE